MSIIPPLPARFATTRAELQRVAVHVLARRRSVATGRFGLRATPGGIATPAFGDDLEVVRTSGACLVHETYGRARSVRLTTLAAAARHVGVDLDADLSVGHDTPPLGDRHSPVDLDEASLSALAWWNALVLSALDLLTAELPESADPSAAQLWPEHFDVALDVAWGSGEGQRANLGGSPGDGFDPNPYLYVGPWGPERPGDPPYWNAPFGAVLRYATLVGLESAVAIDRMTAFLRRGVNLLAT